MRTCGTPGDMCNLCCKLVPVAALDKPADQWCQHAVKGRGCGIYANRPSMCQTWRCFWIEDAEKLVPQLRRPDKAHYVIDIGATVVKIDGKPLGASQIYLDPGYTGAWRSDQVLRRLILSWANEGTATLLRHGTRYGTLLLPPPLRPLENGKWVEMSAPFTVELSQEEKEAFFGKDRMVRLEPTGGGNERSP